MKLEFEGKVALLVGAARGIGFAAAKEVSEAGAKVAIADIDGDAAQSAAGGLGGESAGAIGLRADISDLDSVEAMVSETANKLGPPDIVVVTAAVVDDKLFIESGPEDWQRMMNICLYGPMNVLSAVLPGMIERQYGRVVCLATDSARVGQARLSYYAAAKAGVIALVKSVAQEVGRNGITLNVLSPGATNTELRQAREAAMRAEMGEEKYAARVQKVVRMYPVRRIGEPDDHAGAIAFLVSDRASWITGQVVSVNGGFVMP